MSMTRTHEDVVIASRESELVHPLQIRSESRAECYCRYRAVWERGVAVFLLIPALPVLALTMLLVRLTSSGPAIFRQRRVGLRGQPFEMYKVRPMRMDAELATGPIWSQAGDPRVTPVGRVLRKLHLDELPQLFNVIKGEMSLIGPRPERPEFTRQLARAIPGYTQRLAVLPGITGLAQINLPPDSDLDSVRRKLLLDLDYITTADLLLDARLLLCTALRIVGVSGNAAARLTLVQRELDAPGCAPHPEPTEKLFRDGDTASQKVEIISPDQLLSVRQKNPR